jgi:hypothetical protein
MMTCSRSECTVAETGRCLLNNDPDACPERLDFEKQGISGSGPDSIEKPPLERPKDRPRFPHSQVFGPDDVRPFTSDRYYFLAGILGSPGVGKTALLVSLYLLAAHGKLEGYQFADSLTLMGIDEISRGARRWNGGEIPDEMTAHTELVDERIPGFLHLRLKRHIDGQVLDLLMPDLPGEWSDSLIDHKRTDRLEFLRSADVIWIAIDGSDLAKSRQHVLHRTKLLLQRLKVFLDPHAPKVLVAISHLDQGQPEQRSLNALEAEAAKLNLSLSIVNVASFSENLAIAPGAGLIDLLSKTFEVMDFEREKFWPDTERKENGRYLMRFLPRVASLI